MMDGININCKKQDFIAEIFNGMKTVETRETNSLKSHIGQRVYLIRTGCGKAVIVGEATIGEPVHWTSESDFDRDIHTFLYTLHNWESRFAPVIVQQYQSEKNFKKGVDKVEIVWYHIGVPMRYAPSSEVGVILKII